MKVENTIYCSRSVGHARLFSRLLVQIQTAITAIAKESLVQGQKPVLPTQAYGVQSPP